MIKSIVFDVDGTLVDEDNNISDNLVNLLTSYQKDGFCLIFCTGRSLNGIIDLIYKLQVKDIKLYALCYNGGVGYSFINQQQEELFNTVISRNEVSNILPLITNYFDTVVTYSSSTISTTEYNDYVIRGSEIMKLKIDYDLIHDTPKFLIYDSPQNINDKYKELKDELAVKHADLNYFSSAKHVIEITPKDASKGIGLSKLSNIFNYDEMICFGDSENDISMFKYCKYSVAMGNAITQLKELATYETKSNNEDGIYYFLINNKIGDIK